MRGLLTEIERAKPKPVIVEGKNDRKSLELLGFEDITELEGPLFRVVEKFEGDEVVILTDLDKTGRKLYSRLARDFSKRGVRVDNGLREQLFRTKLRQIEGLRNYLKRNLIDF